MLIDVTTLARAVAASGSPTLARTAERREPLDASAGVAGAGLTEGEARELLGRWD